MSNDMVSKTMLGYCTRQKEEATQKEENQKEGEHPK